MSAAYSPVPLVSCSHLLGFITKLPSQWILEAAEDKDDFAHQLAEWTVC